MLAPVLGLLLICTVDLGFGIYRKMEVQNAAQIGAQYAAVKGFDANAITTAVTGSAQGFTVNASPVPAQTCGCPGASGVTAAICGSTCADGNAAGVYVTVSAASTYTTIIPYPMLPPNFSLASQSMVRIQ
jgi:Flp pilus assembly protein TadG